MTVDDSHPPKPEFRWYRLTPDRLLIALLPIEGLLLLSERFRWFAFNEHKGWTVLIGGAVVCLAVVFLLLWLGVSLVSRLRFQFSIRSMLLFTVVVAVVCSWFAVKMQQARRQGEAVEVIEKGDGWVLYDYQLDANAEFLLRTAEPPGPPWLRDLLGVDFLSDVKWAHGGPALYAGMMHHKGLTRLHELAFDDTRLTDSGLVHLRGLTNLEWLFLWGPQVTDAGLVHLKGMTSLQRLLLTSSEVTDAGLVHLKGLTSLEKLDLYFTQVTDAGAQDLRKALPNCQIYRHIGAL